MMPWAPRWAGLLGPLTEAPTCFSLPHPPAPTGSGSSCHPSPVSLALLVLPSPYPPGQPGTLSFLVSGSSRNPCPVLWTARVFTPQTWGFCITPIWIPSSILGSPSPLDSPPGPLLHALFCPCLPCTPPRPHRPSSCSAQTASCRNARRWCTRCPSTRSTSSTPAPRASWRSSQVRPICPTPAGWPPPLPAMHVYAYAQWAHPPVAHTHTPGPSQFPQVPPPHLCCGQVSERPPTGSKFPSF